MEYPELGEAVHPININFQEAAGPGIRSCFIQPERLCYSYQVPPERELKFEAMVRRLLSVVKEFESRSPLYVCVMKKARLWEEQVEWQEWTIQFQVNQFGRPDEQVAGLVFQQANKILQDIGEYLHA